MVLIVAIVIFLLLLFVLYKIFGTEKAVSIAPEALNQTVEVGSVKSLLSDSSFTAVGVVTAVSEARLQTEAGGRVTSVTVKIGDTVRAGTILASIESSSERAFLLQAQGAYEAALAGAQQGDSGARDAQTGLTSAQNSALTAVRASYTAVNNVLISSIDMFYTNPQGMVPGVRVSGDTSYLSSERVAFQTIMPLWQSQVNSANAETVEVALNDAEARTTKMIRMLDALIAITSTANNTENLLDKPLSSYSSGLLADRSVLNGVIANIQGARSGVTSAKENITRASLGATNNQVSVANAQVKIALGSLRAAQSNYEKTLVRTPITGVINALYIKTGEFVAPGFPSAIVANNNGLQIDTAISEEDRAGLTVGDKVMLDGSAEGVISAIAGAIDPSSGKIALKIGIDENGTLKNGSTVSVSFSKETSDKTTEIRVPLSAVKMTGSGPILFSVSEAKTLTAIPVVLGAISGDSVVVVEGITLDSVIVVDARGFKEGQAVTIKIK